MASVRVVVSDIQVGGRTVGHVTEEFRDGERTVREVRHCDPCRCWVDARNDCPYGCAVMPCQHYPQTTEIPESWDRPWSCEPR